MSKLANLQLSARTRAGMLKSPILLARAKLADNLRLQIEGAKAELEGQAFVRREKRWVTNEETGVREFREVPVKFRAWWWRDEKGGVLLSLKHGARPLEIRKEKPTIEVGEEKGLVPILRDLVACIPQVPCERFPFLFIVINDVNRCWHHDTHPHLWFMQPADVSLATTDWESWNFH